MCWVGQVDNDREAHAHQHPVFVLVVIRILISKAKTSFQNFEKIHPQEKHLYLLSINE
jgi:hypothetical protein